MCVYLHTKFQVSNIFLASFRLILLPPSPPPQDFLQFCSYSLFLEIDQSWEIVFYCEQLHQYHSSCLQKIGQGLKLIASNLGQFDWRKREQVLGSKCFTYS